MNLLKHKLFRLAILTCLFTFSMGVDGLFAYEIHSEIVGLEGHHRWRHRWGSDDGDDLDFYAPYPPIHDRNYRPHRFNQSHYPECGYVWQSDRYVSGCEQD